MAQRQATNAAAPTTGKKTSGGESFQISTEGFSARVAMNRPPRLSSQLNMAPSASGTTATARRASQAGKAPASGSKGGEGPQPAIIETPSLMSPTTTAFLGATPTGSLQSELCSPLLGSTPPALLASNPPTTTPDGSWVYQPPPNNQRSFYFEEDGLHFTSEFDSGNLIQVERVAPMKYVMYSCPDCGNSAAQTNNRQWFHFAVRGGVKGAVLQMQMIGLMNCKMYSTVGWTPVAAVFPGKPVYQRVGTRVVVQKLASGPATPGYPNLTYKSLGGGGEDGDDGDGEPKKERKEPETVALNLSFEYRFEVDVPASPSIPFGSPECPAVFIASNHPYNVERQKKSIAAWKRRAAASTTTLFHREVLCRTLDGREVDLLTITSTHGRSSTPEPSYYSGIPLSCAAGSKQDDIDAQPTDGECAGDEGAPSASAVHDGPSIMMALHGSSDSIARPPSFPSKRYVLLTARVHPGEAPASHIMQGAIDFLLDSADPRAAQLLKDYVFIVVPMLNPDGVARGHSRADTTGQNLNRMYRNPDPRKHPTIFALRHLMLTLESTGRLALYVDMHAHANKKGAFFFGNAMPVVDQVQNLLYPKLVALNTPHFEFTQCNFSESNMFAMGKNGETKDGSSRVTIFQETGFVHSYTIESSYVTGNGQNPIAANPAIPGEELDVLSGTPSPKYNQSTFADVGKALLVALLDFHGTNPCSRIPNGPHRSLRGVVTWLQRWLMFEVFEWCRRTMGGSLGAIAAKPSAAAALSSVNLETVSPLTLSVNTMLALDIPSDPITLKGCKELPPTTFNNFPELLLLMKRDQAANAAGGSGAGTGTAQSAPPAASKSAPPMARVSSMTRLQTNGADARKPTGRPNSRR
jgi:cytosolic carboxypeptidase protein 5